MIMKEFILENWLELLIALMAFLKVIVNLTPSEKDNQIFGLIDKVIDAVIPNRKKK
jgi:hypothetical protein